MRCLSVCLSVSLSRSNKHIFKIVSLSGSRSILVFCAPMLWQYSNGDLLTGASNAGGIGRNRDSEPMSGFTACCQCCDRPGVINTAPPDHGSASVTLIASSMRRSLLIGGDDEEMFMKKSQHYCTPKTNRTAFNCTQ